MATVRLKPLNKRFPGKYVQRTKIWTPDGDSMEVTGPMSDLVGELLIQILVRTHPSDAQAAILQKCGDDLMALQEREAKS